MARARLGRAARRAERQDGAGSGPVTSIWPGIEGGRYRPLTPEGIAAVHRTALRILSEIGLANATPRCIEVVSKAGGDVSESGRLLFPVETVERVLKTAGRGFKLYGQRPEYDLDPSGARIHLGTSGAAVHIVDSAAGTVRDSRLSDLYDMARLAEALPNIHMFQRTVVARDIEDTHPMELNTAYACARGTAKPIGTSFSSVGTMRSAIEVFHMIAGGEAAWRSRPFCCVSTCFVVPPLTFAAEALEIIECAAETGTPLKLVSAGQAGATSPAPLAGAVAQQTRPELRRFGLCEPLEPWPSSAFWRASLRQ
ncbi:MAG: trimethylamine methyltransferase family protein [Pseudomonadota bacterium]